MMTGAHILLPAAAWGEKSGTVTNSNGEFRASGSFLPLPGEAKPDWWIVAQVAQRLGYGEAFDYESAADIFREHAALSAYENDGRRDFDIGACADIDGVSFDAMAPFQWPRAARQATGRNALLRKRQFLHTRPQGALHRAGSARLCILRPMLAFAFTLNTGRVRDQWHTMTRTGLSPRLASHLPEPFVEDSSG